MATEKQERIKGLVARMPKAVRDEVARLEAEVATLQVRLAKAAAADEKASFSSPVGIIDHTHEVKDWKQTHSPLPVHKPIRFYRQDLTPEQRKDSDCYVEVHHPREPAAGKDLIVELHSGFGNMLVRPRASNVIHIIVPNKR